jgi:5-methylcytosine-specific restriction endonuclease McrA
MAHFDLTTLRRAKAVALGAVEITSRELGLRLLVARAHPGARERLAAEISKRTAVPRGPRPRKPCAHATAAAPVCARCRKVREARAKYDREHAEQARDRKRRYDQTKKAKRKAKRWWARFIAVPENRRRHNDRRRLCTLRKRGVDIERDAPTLEGVWKAARGRCALCGLAVPFPGYHEKSDPAAAASIDHITPISKGGSHHWKNCRLAHNGCNLQRGAGEVPAAQVRRSG